MEETRMSMIRAALLGGVVAVAASVAGQGTAEAATKYCDGPKLTWKYSLWGKRRAVTEGAEYLSKAVKDATCGNFDIKLYYGEQISKAKENLDGIHVGAIEAAFICASYHPGKTRALGVLDLPFLPIQDLDVLRVVHDKMYQHPAFKAELSKWNTVWYMTNLLPQYEYMGRGKPPLKVADFKGLRMRALGGMGDAVKALGAVPTTMPASEVYTALQRGTIDAAGFPYSYTFSAFKLDEISSWYTTNMSAGSANCFTGFNKAKYEALPAQYKKILDEVKGPAYQALKEAYVSQDKINIPKWEKEGKLKAITYGAPELAEFRKIGGQPVWDEWIKENEKDVPAKELFDLVLKYAKEAKKK
jgi:TRAP-type C4-dicarboxylate transport system substrate-binding protein